MGPIPLTLLLSAAFAGFAWLAWRKLSIVAALQPEIRWDRPAARLANVLRLGVLQTRMLEGDFKPGLMHLVIFLGFMTLLVRKLQLIVLGYDAHFVFPGAGGAAYTLLKDLVEVAVVAAVLYGFWRRFVGRPSRLEPNREALVVLGLILAIMLTDFLYDGFKFALLSASDAGIAHERAWSPVGGALANLFQTLPEGTLAAGYHAFYWIQMLTVLSFLVILPVGEHFHIVTALPALFFARATPLARVPSVNLEALMAEDASDIKVGVRTALDLAWKDGFDAYTCTECGRCKDACPTFLTGKPLAMKWVHDSVKHHLLEQRTAILAHDEATLPPLVGPVITPDTLWACTSCGYCERACPIELELLGKIFRLRQHQVLMEGAFPPELKTVFDNYESAGNPWGLPADTRGDWARELGVAVARTPEDVAGLDYLFYVGSAQSFDDRNQKVARAFVRVLQSAGVRFAILGPAEGSTGECVRRAGNEMLFQALAQPLVETLNGLGVTRIVTCDPHAFNSLRHEYPEFGGHYEVRHHTQVIAELIAAGRLQLAPRFERVILHDPCYLARHNGEYQAPRAVLAAVSRDAPLEFPLAREKAMCCGAGGGRFWMEEHLGRRINVTRVEQALPQSPQVIATACPYCLTMIKDGLATLGRDDVSARDLAELVAEALPAAA